MALVFMGTPEFALPSLRALHEAGYRIAAVYTRPDRPAGRGLRPRPPPVKELALALGLPVRQPDSLRRPEAVEELRALSPEVIVVCAYGQILRRPVLELPPKGVLNVHPSLLPRHRGPSPIPAAILAGDSETGVTIMLMDEGMDTGPILCQRSLPISPFDTAGTLAEKLSRLAADLLLETLPRWLRGGIAPVPQDESRATVTRLLRKEDGIIDWALPAEEVWRRVRAFAPWPGAYTYLDGEQLHIWAAWPLEGDSGSPPGTVVALSPEQASRVPPAVGRAPFAVQTGRGLLAVTRLQRAGRRALPADEFLRGMPGLVGRQLGARPKA
ncbi:MAG TPA: methionyl-tRNA formyltransferase [Dehalococcoidia bacterium]|nr:methionyl-tRNA formyltransferase [Dehalococcoidia bacterium]